MKRKNTFILLAIFIAGSFSVALTISNATEQTSRLTNSLDTEQTAQISPTPVVSRIAQNDPRGHFTGRMFFSGFDDTESDGYYDTLMIDVEVKINTSGSYVVMAALYDRTFQRKYYNPYENELYFEEGYHLWGNSSFQDLTIGLHNITVYFNCTQMRALKLAGPYMITHIQLAEGSSQYNYEVFEEKWSDNPDEKPLFIVPQVFDINTFDEPMDAGSFLLNDVVLSEDFLEVNITFQSFSHRESRDEPYYIRLALRNATGETIGHLERTIWLQSNVSNEVTLVIPKEFLGLFDFGGNPLPTLSFEEVAIVELNHRGAFDTCNMSYAASAYSIDTIDVSSITQVQILGSGETSNFGSLSVNESVVFGIIPQTFNDVLHMEVDRTEPQDVWNLPDFDVWYHDGFGRIRGRWHQGIIYWEDWWDNINTDHYMTHIGKYQGPWLFHVVHSDYGQQPETTQDLTIRVDITEDTSPPDVSFTSPTDGDHIMQYYGIPIKGTGTDESTVTMYQILVDQRVLFRYNPYDWNWGQMPTGDEFSFVWYPPEDIALNEEIEIVIRAFDLTLQSTETAISITINAGTIPSPESTIDKGLEWLRTQQNLDGSWDYQPGGGYGNAGMTALGALCFIQAGLAHEQVVTVAIDYLINEFYPDQDDGQSIYHSTYETSMATTTLVAYNATLPSYNSSLDALIDEAIKWLINTQNDETWSVSLTDPWYGGWRYGDDHQSSDLSVSQWAILALATYDNFNPGLLDPSLWDKVQIFVRRCRGGYDVSGEWEYDGGFTYTPSTEDWRGGGGGSYGSMTAAGIWGLFLSGSEPDDPDIVSALDWINNSYQIVGGNPNYGNSFEYYWYLSASKAFLMAGREGDQWWYDEITNYLNTHMIAESPTRAYWDNTMGQEPPVFATVQAILSQQVFYGHIPTHMLEVTLETVDGSALYLWNSTLGVGYNYTTGLEESSASASYSGLLTDKQSVFILSPTKGEYFIDVFPAASEDGISAPQDMILRARALTDTGHTISYRTEIIQYTDTDDYPQVLRYRMILSTISGLDINFLFDGYEFFTHSVNFDSVNYPAYVDIGDEFDVTVVFHSIGAATITSGSAFSIGEDFDHRDIVFSDWVQNAEKIFLFTYSTTGFPAGIRTIVIGLISEDTNPVIIRIKVQVGNRAPEGSWEELNQVLSGTETITWTASDPDGDSLTFNVILVEPDATEVTLKSDTTDTTYSFDTTAYTDDTGYKIIVEISDGTDTIRLESNFFEIKNAEDTKEPPDVDAPGFEVIFALLALGFILIWFRRKK